MARHRRRPFRRSSFVASALSVRGLLQFAGWLALAAPRPPAPGSIPLQTRLTNLATAGLPVREPCVVRWNRHGVPFAEAHNDHDAALLIGLVHAHLRLGQMEALRRVAYGRVSEMVGEIAVELDRTLRLLEFGRAVPEIEAVLPQATRDWLDAFVAGVNHVLFNANPPHEFALFGLKRERWTVADVLTLGRLLSFDNFWLVLRRLLPVLDDAGGSALWNKLADIQAEPDLVSETLKGLADSVLSGVNNRSGSNAWAMRDRSTGAAWLACDPHLGLSLPANWLLMGYRAASHEAVGLMLPGMPYVASGTNGHIAWGGTSLHAHASELVDASRCAPEEITERTETIGVRWGEPRTVRVRASADGPIVSDSRFFRSPGKTLALRWLGHRPSDEHSALLDVAKARDWSGFRDALRPYAVPGLNMIYADAAGHVGHLLACWIPSNPSTGLIAPKGRAWTSLASCETLPSQFDPPGECVVSANDRPDMPGVGQLFSSAERAQRIRTLLERLPSIGLPAFARIQSDVVSPRAAALARLFAKAGLQLQPRDESVRERLETLQLWDGNYDFDSGAGALFEGLLFRFCRRFYRRETLQAYLATWAPRDLITQDIEAADAGQVGKIVVGILKRDGRLGRRSWTDRPWGELHRLRLEYPLGAIPFLGRRYRFGEGPVSGGSETVMKTSNTLTDRRHMVRFGSNARFIANLADRDDNWFALMGGQDGWFGSVNFLDLAGLWRKGEYIRLPLSTEAVRQEFPIAFDLAPAQDGR